MHTFFFIKAAELGIDAGVGDDHAVAVQIAELQQTSAFKFLAVCQKIQLSALGNDLMLNGCQFMAEIAHTALQRNGRGDDKGLVHIELFDGLLGQIAIECPFFFHEMTAGQNQHKSIFAAKNVENVLTVCHNGQFGKAIF